MEQRQIFRRSRVIVAAFALLFLIAVSSSVILLSDDELSAEEIDGINYTLNSPSSGKATVTAITGGYSGDIVIPATVSSGGITYTVSNIAASAFFENTGLTSVIIGSQVTSIGTSAFEGCTGLTTVLFEAPSSLGTIETIAFSGCNNLEAIIIPNSVTSIGSQAFTGCSRMTTVTFESPSSLETLAGSVFYNCSSIESITIPNSVTSIGGHAFSGCSGMTSLEFEAPSSLVSIGGNAFNGCSKLESVIIPDSVTTLEGSAFNACSKLAAVTIPNSVVIGGSSIFGSCPIRTLTIAYSAGRNTSSILGASFNWKIQGQNGEVTDLVIDASDLSIQNIEGKAGKRVIFTENATGTTGGSFYDPDGPVLMTGSERANKIYTYDAAETKWFAFKHTVTFEENGGTQIPDGRVFDGYTLADPGAPLRYGYVFEGWFLDPGFTEAYNFSTPVISAFTLYAEWTPEFVSTITSSAGPGGWIDPSGPQDVPYDGITFTFKGNTGYRIKDVKVDGVSAPYDVDQDGLGTYSFTSVEEEHTIWVEFEAYHTVSVNNPSNGSADVSDDAPVHGDSVTVTIRSNVGYTLDVLTDNGADVLASAVEEEEGVWTYTLAAVTSDHTIFVAFVKITYEMIVSYSGEGTLDPDSSFIVEYGDNATFTFKAVEGHRISEVLADGVSVAYDTGPDGTGTYIFLSIASDHTFEVIFVLETHDVILVPGDGYTLVPAEGFSSPVDHKGSFAFVFTLNEGYDLSVPVIRMNGTEIITLGGVRSTTIVLLNIIEDAEITVSGIEVNIYTVTVTSEGDMTFTYVIDDNDPIGFTAGPGGSYSISVSHGSVLVIQAMPGEGHQFKWTNTGAGTSDGNVLTINVTSDEIVGGSLKDSWSELTTYILFFAVAVAILLLLMFGRARLYP